MHIGKSPLTEGNCGATVVKIVRPSECLSMNRPCGNRATIRRSLDHHVGPVRSSPFPKLDASVMGSCVHFHCTCVAFGSTMCMARWGHVPVMRLWMHRR